MVRACLTTLLALAVTAQVWAQDMKPVQPRPESQAEDPKARAIREAYEDLEFRAGDQWPAEVKRQREADSRPCLTINKIPAFCQQITGDIRAGRPSKTASSILQSMRPARKRAFSSAWQMSAWAAGMIPPQWRASR